MTDRIPKEFDWLEVDKRPLKDGIHDSGFRYITIVGVTIEGGREVRTDLHQWSDHIMFNSFIDPYSGVNIDFTRDGTMRIMPWGGGKWKMDGDKFYSSAMFGYSKKGRK